MLRPLKNLLISLGCILLSFSVFLSAQALDFDALLKGESSVPYATDSDYLPVEEAFQISGHRQGDNVIITLKVTPEHYLYRHMLDFEALDSSATQLGEPNPPQGEIKYDPFMQQDLEIYPQTIQVAIPITTKEEFPELRVSFQGCANAGLCYPPTSINLIPLTQSTLTPNSQVETETETEAEAETIPVALDTTLALKQNITPTEMAESSDDAFLSSLLSDASLLQTLLLFYLGGLALTFTPCVLPMLPIISSVVVSSEGSRRHRVLLAFSYVLAMALTYAVAGILMGTFGASLNLQAHMQSPWLLIPFTILFVLLALAMFGVYELQLPAVIRDKLLQSDQKTGAKYQGTPTGAALAGLFSTLLVSPCVSAPLAGALIFISSTGDIAVGGLSLFALGLGMGTPLFLVGIGGAQFLPKAGVWMEGIKRAFGLMLLGVAIWMMDRLIPAHITLLLWGALAIGTGVCLGALEFVEKRGWAVFRQIIGLLLLIFGTSLFLNGLNPEKTTPVAQTQSLKPFTKVTTSSQLNAALAQAAAAGQPAFVDVYADWCISCKVFEKNVLAQPNIQRALAEFATIKLDLTDNSADQQQILKKYNLFGPPAYLFYNKTGENLPKLQKQGEISRATFLDLLQKARLSP